VFYPRAKPVRCPCGQTISERRAREGAQRCAGCVAAFTTSPPPPKAKVKPPQMELLAPRLRSVPRRAPVAAPASPARPAPPAPDAPPAPSPVAFTERSLEELTRAAERAAGDARLKLFLFLVNHGVRRERALALSEHPESQETRHVVEQIRP